MNKQYISTSGLPADAKRRALLGLGMASVLAAAGCGGGGGGGVDAAPSLPPGEAPPPVAPPLQELRAWQLSQEINQGDTAGVDIGEPTIALDAQGGGMAVWLRTTSGRDELWASRMVPSGTWQPIERVDADADAIGGALQNPRIAIDANGNVIAVWEAKIQGRLVCMTNRFSIVDKQWGSANPLPLELTSESSAPQVAMDADGNAVAVWAQGLAGQGRVRIWSRRYVIDQGWASDVMDAENGSGGFENSFNPQIAIDVQGDAVVIWQQLAQDQSGNELWGNRLVANALWSQPFAFVPGLAATIENPFLAVGSDRSSMVVYEVEQTDGSRGLMATYLTGSVESTSVTQIVAPGQKDVANPRVALDGTGHALAVWDQPHPLGQGRIIVASRFSARPAQGQLPWTASRALEVLRGGESSKPLISMDAAGNALVVWGRFSDSNNPETGGVLAARYRAEAGEWTTTGQALQDSDAPAANSVRIAVRPEGTAVAIWRQTAKASPGVNVDSIWTAEFK